jgi:hypothetical protein
MIYEAINVIASEAKQSISTHADRMDCRAASLLAMTEETATEILSASFRGARQRELWCAIAHLRISRNDLEVPDRTASRPVRNDNKI